jgi:hypothetical protein
MLNSGLKRPPAARSESTVVKRRPSALIVCLLGVALLAPAYGLTWASLQWRKLDQRARQAEAQLAKAQKQLAVHGQRKEDLREVEVSLRQEMSQLASLVDQVDGDKGIGISRGTIAEAFRDLEIVNKDVSAAEGSMHYAIECPAGSIQLRGPSGNLTRIEFYGALQGVNAEASTNMLAKLLATAAPDWQAEPRVAWLSKLANIYDDVRVYKDIDRLRVEWHSKTRDGVRFDVLSIEAR